MKIKNLAITTLILAITLTSCEDLLQGKSNLPGTWDLTEMTQNYYTGGVFEGADTLLNVGTMTFTKEGTGTYSLEMEGEAASGSFDWFEKNDKLFMNFLSLADSIWTDNLAIAWDVVEDTETDQNWSAELTQYEDMENDLGDYVPVLVKMEIIVKLEKN